MLGIQSQAGTQSAVRIWVPASRGRAELRMIPSTSTRLPNVMEGGRGSATPCGTSYNAAMGYQYLGGPKGLSGRISMLSLRVRPLLALCAVAAVLAFAMTD